MIGLLDFEGGGDKKKEEKGNEREKGKEPSFFSFFLFLWSVNGRVWEFGYVGPCVFFLFTFFFIQLLITNWIRFFFFFFFSERIENEIVCNIAYLLLCLSNGKIRS